MHRRCVPAARTLVVLALASAVAGCGGRLGAGERSDATAPATGPAAAATSAIASPAPPQEAASVPTASSPTSTLDLPDISGIDSYLADLDAALGADRGAAAQEGSDQ